MMVAEPGRYKSPAPAYAGHASRSTTSPSGKYGSTYYSSDQQTIASSSRSYAAAGAPAFGRIRVTQSVERDVRGPDLGSSYSGSRKTSYSGPSYGRRFSLSTDKILLRDKASADVVGSRALHSPFQSAQAYQRRASLTVGSSATAGNQRLIRNEYGDADSEEIHDYEYYDGKSVDNLDNTYAQHSRTSVGSSGVSLRGNLRTSSVSRYESQNSIGRPAREPSVSRYQQELQMSSYTAGRDPSVSRYEGRPVSLSRASSVSRYEVQPSFGGGRSASVSRFERQSSVGRSRRSPSLSRYDRRTPIATSEDEDLDSEHSRTWTTSVSSRSDHLVDGTSVTAPDAKDDDSAYELRRQLRALRNQQIRAGSVTHHERQEHLVHHNPPHHHQLHLHPHQEPVSPVTRPRSYSTSSYRDLQRRYKVAKVHTVVKAPSQSSLVTSSTSHAEQSFYSASHPEPTLYSAKPTLYGVGNPEPTLYGAKVFRSTHTTGVSPGVVASSREIGFVDDREDLTSYVLEPGEKFLPTDVSVSLLPSGKKAVTYTRFSQKGQGDQQHANEEIERIIRKTKILQDSMHTLEDFVKRNRSLFPADIIIYQKIVFYLLSEAELIKMGERPDAEIYGVKIREKLVAPIGTDVASILRRFYSKHQEVDVQYEHPEYIRQQLKLTEEEATSRRPRSARGPAEDQDWQPTRRSHSKENHLYTDEDEMMFTDRYQKKELNQSRPTLPEFTHKLRTQRAAVGQSVRLSCSVSAFPDPVVKWYRGNQEITQNGRFSVKNNFGLCTLTISEVTPEDGVLYTVKAVNSEGEATTSALLEVYDFLETVSSRHPRKRSSEPGLGAGAGAGRRPFFLLEARNLWADVGERAVLEVQAAGKPLPSFTWVKDDDELVEDDRVRIVSDGYGNCKLIIKEIRSSDFGTYRCRAQNEDGVVESIASLFCVGNESFRPGQALRDELRGGQTAPLRGKRPQFTHVPPSRIDVIEGEPLTLQCAVEGDPKPLITWYKGVRELTYTGRYRVLEERNNYYVMQIKSTLPTDAGEYTVTAHNVCGFVEFIVYVNVFPAARPIDDYDPNWKRLDLTPMEYDVVTKTRQGKMPPIFVKKLPREKQMKAGSSLKFDCYIEESKPREYLVDVNVIPKDNKREGRASLSSEISEKASGHQKRDQLYGETGLGRRAVTSASPSDTEPPPSSSPGSVTKSTLPPVQGGIEKLAENLASDISRTALEAVNADDLDVSGSEEVLGGIKEASSNEQRTKGDEIEAHVVSTGGDEAGKQVEEKETRVSEGLSEASKESRNSTEGVDAPHLDDVIEFKVVEASCSTADGENLNQETLGKIKVLEEETGHKGISQEVGAVVEEKEVVSSEESKLSSSESDNEAD